MNKKFSRIYRTKRAMDVLRDAALGTAITHLPDAARWVMQLSGKHGLTINEIASLAGVSPKVVTSTKIRGFTLVQEELLTRVVAAS